LKAGPVANDDRNFRLPKEGNLWQRIDMLALILQQRLLRALCYAVTYCLVTHAQAQISVGLLGAPADAFGSIPGAGSWSTKTLPGAAGAPEGAIGADAN